MQQVYGTNYANLTKEEQKNAWEKKFELPKSKGSDYDYYDKVRTSKDTIQIKDHIMSVVDAI